MTGKLDFLGIGAAKAGTTALFEYLRHHEEVWMPAAKEVPFFSRDSRWEQGWCTYFQEVFSGASNEARLGKITPQYMADMRVPARVAEVLPDVQLIVLLRDPVDRAYSDWRMRVRAGRESRSFEEAVSQQLQPATLEEARSHVEGDGLTAEDLYVVRSEYGRILTAWREHFEADRFFVEFSENLRHSTRCTMRKLTNFLDLSETVPDRFLGKQHHRGADAQRFRKLIPFLQTIRPARFLWHTLPPERRMALLRWFRWNVGFVRRPGRDTPSEDVRWILWNHFRDDVSLLEGLLAREAPWRESGG